MTEAPERSERATLREVKKTEFGIPRLSSEGESPGGRPTKEAFKRENWREGGGGSGGGGGVEFGKV